MFRSAPHCVICLEDFDSEDRAPYTLLPCMHSVCKKDSINVTDCSECGLAVFSVAPNYGLKELLEKEEPDVLSSSSQRGVPLCDLCNQDEIDGGGHEATVYCTDCNLYMCEKLSVRHSKNQRTKSHRLKSWEDAQNEFAGMEVCKVHGKPLEIWCKEDLCLSCVMCAVSDHRNHALLHYENFTSSEGTEFLDEINRKLEDLRSAIEFLTSLERRLEHLKPTFVSNIKQSYDQMITTAKERRKALKEEVNNVFKGRTKALAARMEALQSCNEYFINNNKMLGQLYNSKQSKSFLALYVAMRNKTDGLDLKEEENVTFTIDSLLIDSIASSGNLEVVRTDPSQCIVKGIGFATHGEIGTFEVLVYNSLKERKLHGGDKIDVEIANASEISVTDQGDGSYLCSYRAPPEPEDGSHLTYLKLNIRLGRPGRLLPQCPITVHFEGEFYGRPHARFGNSSLLQDGHCLCIDDQDVVYITDYSKDHVTVYDGNTGRYLRTISKRGSGSDELRSPWGVDVSGGLLYVVDSGNKKIKVFNKESGALVRMLAPTGEAALMGSRGIVVDGDEIFLSDADLGKILVLNANTGGFMRTIGKKGREDGELDRPVGLVLDGDLLYVGERARPRVQVFNKRTGEWVKKVVDGVVSQSVATLKVLTGLAIIGDQLFICDTEANCIVAVNKDTGAFIRTFGCGGTGEDHFKAPWDMKAKRGQLFIADTGNRRIQVFI